MAVFRLLHCLNASAQSAAENFRVFEERHSLCSKEDIPCVRRMTLLAFEEGHSLCSKNGIPCVRRKDIPCVRRKTFLVFEERHSLCSKTTKRQFLVVQTSGRAYLKQILMQKLILTSKNA